MNRRLTTALCGCILSMMLITLTSQTSSAQQERKSTQESIIGNAQKSTVYIRYQYTDTQTDASMPVVGTGFIVSQSGFVLTSAHLFSEWQKQNEANRQKNQIRVTIGDVEGSGNTYTAHVVSLSDPQFEDFAVLSLPYPGRSYDYAPICAKDESSLDLGAELIALGFPSGSSIQPVRLIVGTREGARWKVSGDTDPGMSGGPVYNPEGLVVGMVRGGSIVSSANRSISPISGAYKVAGTHLVEQCGAVPKACASPPKITSYYKYQEARSSESQWRGGGYNQEAYCNDFIGTLKTERPSAVYSVVGRSERSESTCSPFNCPRYKYYCTVQIQDELVKVAEIDSNCQQQ